MTQWTFLFNLFFLGITFRCNFLFLPVSTLEWASFMVRAGFERVFDRRHFRLRLFIFTSFFQHWRFLNCRVNLLIMSITILYFVEISIFLFMTPWTFLFNSFLLRITFCWNFLLLPLSILEWAFFLVRAWFQRLFNHRHFRLWLFVLPSFVQHWRLFDCRVIFQIMSITILHFADTPIFLFMSQWTFLFYLFDLVMTFRCNFLLLPFSTLEWAFVVVMARFQGLFGLGHFRLWLVTLTSFVQHWRLFVCSVILLIMSITILLFVEMNNCLFLT